MLENGIKDIINRENPVSPFGRKKFDDPLFEALANLQAKQPADNQWTELITNLEFFGKHSLHLTGA